MDVSEAIKKLKLVDEKDMWMSKDIKSVDVNDDCKKLKELFDSGVGGIFVNEVSEFGDDEIVGWITKNNFENFKENDNCKAGDVADKNFGRISPAATVFAAELKLKKENAFALPVITVHFGREIPMGYLTTEDIENIKRKYNK